MSRDSPYAAIKPNPDVWEVQRVAMEWAREAADVAAEAFLTTKRMIHEGALKIGPGARVLHELAVSCAYTSESAFLLVSSVKPWDSDVLARSVVEGTVKFIHLAHGSSEERAAKLKEFDEELPEMNRVKRHKRTEEFLAAVENPEAEEWRPLRELILSPIELQELTGRFPPKRRRELESRWSFGGILATMQRTPGHPYRELGHLIYGYGMSSHVLHQDSDGIGIVSDRIERSQERRDAVTLAHCSRILSDLLTMGFLRGHAASQLTGAPKEALEALRLRWMRFSAQTQAAHARFREVEFGTNQQEGD